MGLWTLLYLWMQQYLKTVTVLKGTSKKVQNELLDYMFQLKERRVKLSKQYMIDCVVKLILYFKAVWCIIMVLWFILVVVSD